MERVWKRAAAIIAGLLLPALLSGCSVFGSVGVEPQTIFNGTTSCNIINKGFAVQDGDSLYYYIAQDDEYEIGDIVKVDPKTGESSLAMKDGGLYMSIYGGYLYYCREDGIYRAPLDTFEAQRIVEGKAEQLQIEDETLFFLRDGVIMAAGLDGQDIEFTPIENADCLTLFQTKIFYVDTKSGNIKQADVDGQNVELLFDISAKEFGILETVFYYIDSADGYIKRITHKDPTPETVVSEACSGFNINLYGLYYTRNVDGQMLACNANIDGGNEQVITNAGESARHYVCLFDNGATMIRKEDLPS